MNVKELKEAVSRIPDEFDDCEVHVCKRMFYQSKFIRSTKVVSIAGNPDKPIVLIMTEDTQHIR